jgi:hypothetical protein
LAEIEDLERLSIDLQHAFKDPQNTDLSIHFPDTVHRYSGELDGVQSSLLETMNKCVAGKREQFVTFCGKQAVGMSTVTNQNEAPEAVNPNWPNVSEFIFRPYRDTRLGTLTVRNCIEVVKERFDGRAWTYVRKGNVPAEQLVQQAGFVMTNIIVPGQEHQHVYLLGGDRQNRVWYNNREE